MEKPDIVLVLSKAIEAVFGESQWIELGYLTKTSEWVNNHGRLLRSLYWHDSDYKGHVLNTVSYILRKDSANLGRLLAYQPLSAWFEANDPSTLGWLKSLASGFLPPEFPAPSSSDAVREALADAEVLLRSRGPSSAIDRVHTAFHGYLKAACAALGLVVRDDATANVLLKALTSSHPQLRELGSRGEDVRRVLRSAGTVLDALGTVRNNASLAHPNDARIGHPEALLVINITRSLLLFLETKLSAPPI